MNKHQSNLLNLDFAYFQNVNDVFIGQKVSIKCLDKDVVGRVFSASKDSIAVQLFGDVSGFVLDKTFGVFEDSFIEIPLSPSILGRRIDIFGNALDDLSPIIPVTKSQNLYTPIKLQSHKDQLVGENDWIIRTQDFELQKGQVKSYADFKKLLPAMDLSNLVLILVGTDSMSNDYASIFADLVANDLDKVSLVIQSSNIKDLELLPFTTFQVSSYFAGELGFDVLVIVMDSDLMPQVNQSNFYFVNSFDQLTISDDKGSISVINS
jgi:hypothetical protein